MICWNSGKHGHLQKDYKEEKKKKNKKDSNSVSEKEYGDAFITSLYTHASYNAWLIDLGASFHITPNRNWFSKYENFDGVKVYLGDNLVLDIVGRGSICVKFF